MRALACLALIAIGWTTPALAQRVDTRRNDVVQRAEGVATCRFNAVPELKLKEYPAGASLALLHKPAEGVPPGKRVDLEMRYTPEAGHGFNVRRQQIGVRVEGFANLAGIRIEVDGKSSGIELRAPPPDVRDGGDWMNVPEKQGDALAALLEEASSAGAVLIDDNNRVIGRYEWDIRKLADIPELLELVHWRCTTPDRG